MSSIFQQLLAMAGQQEQPQRMLFLFAQAEEESSKKDKGSTRGTISPVMCVDKLPSELGAYAELVAEADNINKDWNFVFISGLNGQDGRAPTSEEAEPFLNKMTNDVASGQDLSRYMIMDRDENAVEVMR